MKRSCKWAQVLLKLRPEEERTASLHAAEKLPAFLVCPRRSKYPQVALGSHTPPESTLASCLHQTGIYASALKESLFWGWIASFILPIKIRNVHFSCVFVVGVFLWHRTDLECWVLLNADAPLVLWVFWQRSHTALKPWVFSFPLNRDFIPSHRILVLVSDTALASGGTREEQGWKRDVHPRLPACHGEGALSPCFKFLSSVVFRSYFVL